MHPLSAAIGAHFSDTSEPAEKRAISALEKSKFSTSSTFSTLSPKLTSLPTDLLEANAYIFSIGKFLSAKIVIISCPTAPEAPSTATLYPI